MKITFLGTGTSHGVPMIGCDCPVCKSDNPKNKRLRCSCLIEVAGKNLLIDTSPEFRLQALREDIRRIDAILFTHAHADHVFGLDDIRRYNDMSGEPITCYGNAQTLDTLRQAFSYVFTATQKGGGKPNLELMEVDGPFDAAGVQVTPIPVCHGRLSIYGYRVGDFAYITDCNRIPEESKELLHGLDTLVLGVIRHEPHSTHFSLSEGIAAANELSPKRTFFTHMAHKLEHEATNAELPEGFELAYDGLKLTVD